MTGPRESETQREFLRSAAAACATAIPGLFVLVGLLAVVALYYASNTWCLAWAAGTGLVLVAIALRCRQLDQGLRNDSISADSALRSMHRQALASGIAFGLYPVFAHSLTETGWILNALGLLAAMASTNLLFGLSVKSQLLAIAPIIAIGAPTITIGSGNPGLAAVLLLVAMVLPMLLLGRVARRISMAAVQSAAATESLNAELTAANERLAHSAEHDVLTGLPNRAGFARLVEQAQRHALADESGYAIAFLDLDRFKKINDQYGHAVGDELLLAVADRLAAGSRTADSISRHGGDEFVCLFREVENPSDAAKVGNRLLQSLECPIQLGAHEVDVHASIGVAHVSGAERVSIDELRVRADHALYAAKDRGRNRVELFDDELQASLTTRVETELRLREALDLGRVHGWFQPVIDLETGAIAGAEALVRWLDDEVVQPPGAFLDVAEDALLGWPVTRSVISSVAFLRREGAPVSEQLVPIALNVMPDNIETAVDLMIDLGGSPTLEGITFEITEHRIIDDMAALRRSLAEVRGLGGRVVLDDFGTGYSSLSLLAQLPIDGVKVDCSFTNTITTSDVSRTIVAAIVDIAARMDLEVIAEGVETELQARLLYGLGVRKVQGFLFAAAMPSNEFEQRLLSGDRFVVPELFDDRR